MHNSEEIRLRFQEAERKRRIQISKENAISELVWQKRKIVAFTYEKEISKVISSWANSLLKIKLPAIKWDSGEELSESDTIFLISSMFSHFDQASNIPFFSSFSEKFVSLPSLNKGQNECDDKDITNVLFLRGPDLWFDYSKQSVEPEGFYFGNFIENHWQISEKSLRKKESPTMYKNLSDLVDALSSYYPKAFVSSSDFTKLLTREPKIL